MLLPSGRRTIRSGRCRPASDHSPRLLVEVAAVEHARKLDDAPQLHLAPAPAHRRRAQRTRQRVGGRAERGELLVELRERRRALFSTMPSRSCTSFTVSLSGCTAVRARSKKALRLVCSAPAASDWKASRMVARFLSAARLARRRLTPAVVRLPAASIGRRGGGRQIGRRGGARLGQLRRASARVTR
jgi:hypothetical protein